MDGKFLSYVIDELRTMVSQIEAGREPYNLALKSVVFPELRRQYEAAEEMAALGADQ